MMSKIGLSVCFWLGAVGAIGIQHHHSLLLGAAGLGVMGMSFSLRRAKT